MRDSNMRSPSVDDLIAPVSRDSAESVADVQASARDNNGVFADPSHNSSENHAFPMRGVAIPATQQTLKYMFENQRQMPANNDAGRELVNSKSRSSGSENLGHLIDSASSGPDNTNVVSIAQISRNNSVHVGEHLQLLRESPLVFKKAVSCNQAE